MQLSMLYAGLVLIAAASLYLFVSLKRDLRIAETRALRAQDQLRTRAESLAGELDTLRKEMESIDGNQGKPVGRTIGSSTRVQAMRMIQDGSGSTEIATALGLPRTEVDLLIKVQRLMAEARAEAAAV